ncbi:MAG TPA: DUF4157 domain-containing protein [Pyrinomonadaceae bacterium]|nr:DUF4157 domain-containing protein [Pyrinomonadaceae bacterium]
MKAAMTATHERGGTGKEAAPRAPARAAAPCAQLYPIPFLPAVTPLVTLSGPGRVLQPKLSVSRPDDPYEREADSVAERVMRMPDATVRLQRKCACEGTGEECERCASKQPSAQRRAAPEATGDSGVSEAPAAVHDVLRSGGRPLDASARSFMESRFGHDFGHVRIHTGAGASASAKALNARAYTVGSDVAFAAGEYAPETAPGRHLLAHELAHVLQQRGGGGPLCKPVVGSPDDSAESEADNVADAVMRGGDVAVRLSPSSPVIRRACGYGNIVEPPGCAAGDHAFVPGLRLFRFGQECDEFAPGQEAALVAYARAQAPTTLFELHGFTSVDGIPRYNEILGCARAEKAKTVLTAAAPLGAGIAVSRIQSPTVNHGPTPGPTAERHVVGIRVTTPAPPTPTPTPAPAAPTPRDQAIALADQDSAAITALFNPRRLLATGLFLQIYKCLTDSIGAAFRRGEFEDPLWLARVNHATMTRLQQAFTAPNAEYQQAFLTCNLLDQCSDPNIGIFERMGCNRALGGTATLVTFQRCTEDVGGVHLRVDLRDALRSVGCSSPVNARDYARVVPLFQACNRAILSSSFPVIGGTVAQQIAIPRITEQRNAAWSAAGCPSP